MDKRLKYNAHDETHNNKNASSTATLGSHSGGDSLAIAAHTGPPRPDSAHVAEANAAPAIPAVSGASRNGRRADGVSDLLIWFFNFFA